MLFLTLILSPGGIGGQAASYHPDNHITGALSSVGNIPTWLRGIRRTVGFQRVRHRGRGDVPATEASLVSGPALSSWRKLSSPFGCPERRESHLVSMRAHDFK